MSHQDWKPVVIGKGPSLQAQIANGTVKKDIIEKPNAAKNKQTTVDTDMRKIENTEIGHHVTSTHTLSQQIQQARTAKKLTQLQLNTACNFKKNTVADYEAGRAIVNSNELVAMSKVLGVTLKKPKPVPPKA